VAQISRALRLRQSGDFLVKKHHWRFSDINPYYTIRRRTAEKEKRNI
jgi:hypothetical protein